MGSKGRSLYEILGVDADASVDEIKAAYKERLLGVHPDKMNAKSGRSLYSVNDVQEAYKVLSNPSLRESYNLQLEESYKREGYHNAGDGLDEYSLDEFTFQAESLMYCMDCPRCKSKDGFEFSEATLEEYASENKAGHGGLQVLVQCSSCSLWLKVSFNIVEEYEEE